MAQRGNAGKGRKKGTPNKYTGALKDMILQALANVGGIAYLEAQARKQPAVFLGLVGRVLPLQVKQDGQEPMVPAKVVHEHVAMLSTAKTVEPKTLEKMPVAHEDK